MTMWYKEVPDDQKMTYTVMPKPGCLMKARMLGGQLQALSELMTAMGDERGPHFETFLADISMSEDGAVHFDLVVLPRLEAQEAPPPPTAIAEDA